MPQFASLDCIGCGEFPQRPVSCGFPQGSRVRAAEGTQAQDKPGWFIWSEHFPDPLIHSALLQWQSPIGKRADVDKHASR